jgi:16S rRNA (guanine966-N2)-methyltransferase
MKVIAGKHRGRNIESREDRSLRPTSGMVREAIFNLLKHGKFLKDERFIEDDNASLVVDRNVVDIFCGTGALGLEALSRGARFVTFVDQNPKIMGLVKTNVEHMNETENAAFVRSDSTFLPHASRKHQLAFIDPPYNSGLAVKALVSLDRQGWLDTGAVIIVEHAKKETLTPPENFELLDDRTYNITRLNVLQYRGS